MNSIQSFISGNDSFTAMTYLSKFAQLMRFILENSRKSFIALSDEINTLELYIELERIRFNKEFNFEISVDPEIPVDAVYIPPMLIQPFVENAIKHGLRDSVSEGLLEIIFTKKSNLITCLVRDNGIGRFAAHKSPSAKLEIDGSSSYDLLKINTASSLLALMVASSGNVGIGLESPAVKLEVDGGIKLGDPDSNDDGLLDADGITAVPGGTIRWDESVVKLQVFDGNSWVNLH